MVGGRNGGGKTTLFESVLLCLYGRGPRESKRAYQGRLAGLIHRGADNALAERRASVSVRFQTHREGSTREYIVERTWSPAKDGVFEEVSVKRSQDADGGFEQLDLDRDRWQSYMEGLVPRGIASLFFFDGERVAIMADGDQSDTIMASFDSLLGLDAIDRLRADLRYNLARSLTGDDAHLQTEFDRLTEEKRAAETESETLKESYVQKKAELEATNAKLVEGESHLAVLGGGLAKRRDVLRKDIVTERQSLEGHAKALAEACSSYLPFGVIPDKLKEIAEQMDSDHNAMLDKTRREAALSTIQAIKAALAGRADQETLSIIDGVAPGEDADENVIILGFSSAQQAHILQTIRNAEKSEAGAYAASYSTARTNISRLESSLDSAPDQSEMGPILQTIKECSGEAGRLEAEMDQIDQRRASIEAQIRHLDSKIRETLSAKFKNKKSRRTAELTESVQNTLEEYSRMLRSKKLGLLESYIMEGINTLMHKDLISRVAVNPETFSVTIYDGARNIIPWDTLSKGEHQMLATSILWALARTSGRPLPFMIDTPLARLDAAHRANLLERFFPLASHQTLIFSTDTEIGAAEYRKIRKYVSKSYTIRYDPGRRSTTTRQGYFRDGGGDGK